MRSANTSSCMNSVGSLRTGEGEGTGCLDVWPDLEGPEEGVETDTLSKRASGRRWLDVWIIAEEERAKERTKIHAAGSPNFCCLLIIAVFTLSRRRSTCTGIIIAVLFNLCNASLKDGHFYTRFSGSFTPSNNLLALCEHLGLEKFHVVGFAVAVR